MEKTMWNHDVIVEKMSKDTIGRKMVCSVQSVDNSSNYSMWKLFNTIFKSYNGNLHKESTSHGLPDYDSRIWLTVFQAHNS